MVSSTISKNYRLSMGDSASQPNAQDLRNVLVGLSRFEQLRSAIQWAETNHCVVDMFGSFAKEHHLLLFQSGNESENDGVFSDGKYILSDIRPKNVLASDDGLAIFVIDADVVMTHD